MALQIPVQYLVVRGPTLEAPDAVCVDCLHRRRTFQTKTGPSEGREVDM